MIKNNSNLGKNRKTQKRRLKMTGLSTNIINYFKKKWTKSFPNFKELSKVKK